MTTTGCLINPLAYDTVEIDLPKWKLENFTLYKWKIEIHNQNYADRYFINPEKSSIHISIQKNQPFSITATPIIKMSESNEKTIFFKPAGGLYPFNFDGKKIQLTWENGFSAYIMQQCFKSDNDSSTISHFIHSFNWNKFNEIINTKIQESILSSEKIFFNPWLSDYEFIIEHLCSKNFSANLLNSKKFICVNLNELFPSQQNIKIYSSFIPENNIIQQQNTITINSSKTNFFASETDCILINYSVSKKVSSQIVLMPILIDDL